MAFKKTGDVPIIKVLCTCGHDIKGHVNNCPSCGKGLISPELSTPPKVKKPKDESLV